MGQHAADPVAKAHLLLNAGDILQAYLEKNPGNSMEEIVTYDQVMSDIACLTSQRVLTLVKGFYSKLVQMQTHWTLASGNEAGHSVYGHEFMGLLAIAKDINTINNSFLVKKWSAF